MNKNIKRKPAPAKDRAKSASLIPDLLKEQRNRIIMGITLALISLFILFSMIGFFFSGGIDQSLVDGSVRQIIANPEVTAANPAGKIGAWISDLLINRWFGLSSFIICYLLMVSSLRLAGARVRHFGRKMFIGMSIVLWISLLLGFITESISNLFEVGTGYLFPGGGHGYFVSLWLNSLIGRVGTILFLVFTFIIILFFGFERTFYRCVDYVKSYIRKRQEKALAVLRAKRAAEQAARETAQLKTTEEEGKNATNPLQQEPLQDDIPNFGIEAEENQNAINEEEETEVPDNIYTPNLSGQPERLLSGQAGSSEDEVTQQRLDNSPYHITEFEFSSEISNLVPTESESDTENKNGDGNILLTVNNKNQEETVDRNILPTEDYDPTLDLSNYQYPSLELLEEHSSGNPKVTQEELEENKNKIVETLRNYKIEITKIKATIGPTVTLYEIVPAPGVKISKIKNLEDDIALSLSALGIRIIAPIPGAGTIGIEVPNQNPEIVSMRGIIASKKFQESKYALR